MELRTTHGPALLCSYGALASLGGSAGGTAGAGAAAGGAATAGTAAGAAAGTGLGATLSQLGSTAANFGSQALGTFGNYLPAGVQGPTLPASGLLGGLSGQAGLGTGAGLGGSVGSGLGAMLGQYLNTRAGGFPGLASTSLGMGGQGGGLQEMLQGMPQLQAAVRKAPGSQDQRHPMGILSRGLFSGLLSGGS